MSKLVEPAPEAAVPFTVSAPPVGAELSTAKLRLVAAVFPAASAPVIVWLPLNVAPVQEYSDEVYGPPAGVLSTSAVWLMPSVEIAGKPETPGRSHRCR